MSTVDTSHGWYYRKRGDESGAQGGPYTWADLASFARQGLLSADDLVWHASHGAWLEAASFPGLFTQVEVALHLPMQDECPLAAPDPRRGRRGLGVVALIAIAALLVGTVGASAWWLLARGGLLRGGPDFGVAKTTLPDPASLVVTKQWGEVPANQLGVTLAADGKRKDAQALAKELGGSVVGEIEFINAYQIEFPGSTEAHLAAALAKAETSPKVELAFPNQQDQLDEEIWGVRQDPFSDPIYGEGAGDGLAAIGAGKAWSYIKGSGIELGDVKVGIVDDGLFKSGEGRESEFGGDVEFEYPDPAAGEISTPEMWEDGVANPAGSHGTGVANIIAADPDNGGPAGIAAPLGKKLRVSVIDKYSGQYGYNTTATPDPSDSTKALLGNKTYSFGTLVAITKQIENKAKVINCSFGRTNGSPEVAAAYKKFFEKMAAEHPDVLFVCSAGNEGAVVDGSKRFPSGHALPNVITVGAVDNDGRTAKYSNRASGNYEVTLGAPGTKAVVGMGPDGGAERQDGTSFAAPHVTAAAAILKSLNPELQAGDLKRILAETARKELEVPGPKGAKTSRIIAQNVGGRMLALDEAVFTVINQMRKAKGLAELTREQMEQGGVIDAVAVSGGPGEYTVRGIVNATGDGGTQLSIQVTGEDHAIGGRTKQSVSAPGEASWSVGLPKGKGTIRVTRSDNGAASVITVDRGALEGTWQFPEIWRIQGGKPQKTGGTVTMRVVRDGDGYSIPDWNDTTITLMGDQVKVVRRYSGLLPGEPGGTSVYTGTLQGDEIHGENVDTYNLDTPWDAVRVK